jgi:CubicO group peptidase (beta-lactamase class C family)
MVLGQARRGPPEGKPAPPEQSSVTVDALAGSSCMCAAYGGLVGCAAVIARLALLHLNPGTVDGNVLVSSAAIGAMQRITPKGGGLDFGLGWFRPSHAGNGPAFVEHLGGGSGFFNVIRLYPQRHLGIVVMSNTTRYENEAILAALLDTAW